MTAPAVLRETTAAFAELAWPPTEDDLAAIEVVALGPGDLAPLTQPRRDFALVHTRADAMSLPVSDMPLAKTGTEDAVTHNDVMAPFDWLAAPVPTPPRPDGDEKAVRPASGPHAVTPSLRTTPVVAAPSIPANAPPVVSPVDVPPPQVVHLESSAADVFVAEAPLSVSAPTAAPNSPKPASLLSAREEILSVEPPRLHAVPVPSRVDEPQVVDAPVTTAPVVEAIPAVVVEAPVTAPAEPAVAPQMALSAEVEDVAEVPTVAAPVMDVLPAPHPAIDASPLQARPADATPIDVVLHPASLRESAPIDLALHDDEAVSERAPQVDAAVMDASDAAGIDEPIASPPADVVSVVPPVVVATSPVPSGDAQTDLDRLDAQLASLLALVGRRPEQLDSFREEAAPPTSTEPLPHVAYTPPPTSRLAPIAPVTLPEPEPDSAPVPESAAAPSPVALQLTSLADDLAALAEPIVIRRVERRPLAAPAATAPPVVARAPIVDAPIVDAPVVDAPVAEPPAARRAPAARVPVARAPVARPPVPAERKAPAVRPAPKRRPQPQASGPWVAAAAVFGVIGAAAFGATHLARWQESWFRGDEPDAGTSNETAPAGDRGAAVSSDLGAAPSLPTTDAGAASSPSGEPASGGFERQPMASRLERPASAYQNATSDVPVAAVASRSPEGPDPVDVSNSGREEVEAQPEPLAPVVAEPQPAPEPPPPAPIAEDEQPAGDGNISEKTEGQLYQMMALYMRAYAAMDPSAVQRVWPTADADALARAFEPLKAVRLGIDKCDIVVEGGEATANCPGRAMYLLKDGGPEPQVEQHQWRFTFRRVGKGWRIQDVEVS